MKSDQRFGHDTYPGCLGSQVLCTVYCSTYPWATVQVDVGVTLQSSGTGSDQPEQLAARGQTVVCVPVGS